LEAQFFDGPSADALRIMLTGLHNIDDSFGDYFIYRIGTGFQMKGFERGFIRLGHNFDLVGTKCRVFDQPEDRHSASPRANPDRYADSLLINWR